MPDRLNNEQTEESPNGNMANDELSADELAHLQDQFKHLEQDYKDIVDTFDEQTSQWRKEKGRDRLSQLMTSEEETLSFLENTDPNMRELAIHLAIEHWKIGPRVSDHCERIALTDHAPSVRCMAIAALGKCYRGQRHARIGSMLARIVTQTDLSVEERKSAYLALVLVDGDDRFSISQILLDFPNNMDWEFVKCYLENGE